MIPKTELLSRMQADRQALISVIEGIPEEVLARPNAVGTWSVLDVLAHITAWDGETLRRIAFATSQSNHLPHDIDDDAYWLAWNDEQVEIKRVLGPRGIKVDMAGTWARLIARIEALSSRDYERWAEIDPHAFDERHDLEHAHQLQVWREVWEQLLPWWQRLRRKFTRFSSTNE